MVDELKIASIANRIEHHLFDEANEVKELIKNLDDDEKFALIIQLGEIIITEKNIEIKKYKRVADAVKIVNEW